MFGIAGICGMSTMCVFDVFGMVVTMCFVYVWCLLYVYYVVFSVSLV